MTLDAEPLHEGKDVCGVLLADCFQAGLRAAGRSERQQQRADQLGRSTKRSGLRSVCTTRLLGAGRRSGEIIDVGNE